MKTRTGIFGGFSRKDKPNAADSNNLHISHEHNNQTDHALGIYQCPMKCEGDKTYNEPGNCPVCNMKLMPVDQGHQHH